MDRRRIKEKCAELMLQLEPQEFIGICKILGVKLLEEDSIEKSEESGEVVLSVRPAENLIQDAIDKIGELNKVQSRNLYKLLKAATKEK